MTVESPITYVDKTFAEGTALNGKSGIETDFAQPVVEGKVQFSFTIGGMGGQDDLVQLVDSDGKILVGSYRTLGNNSGDCTVAVINGQPITANVYNPRNVSYEVSAVLDLDADTIEYTIINPSAGSSGTVSALGTTTNTVTDAQIKDVKGFKTKQINYDVRIDHLLLWAEKVPEAEPAVKYTISKAATTNGSFQVMVGDTEAGEAAQGAQVKVVPAPAEEYEVDKVSYSYEEPGVAEPEASTEPEPTTKTVDVAAGEDGSYTFEMPDKNVTVSVTFKEKLYTVTATVDEGVKSVALRPQVSEAVSLMQAGDIAGTIEGTTATFKAKKGSYQLVYVPYAGYQEAGVEKVVEAPITVDSNAAESGSVTVEAPVKTTIDDANKPYVTSGDGKIEAISVANITDDQVDKTYAELKAENSAVLEDRTYENDKLYAGYMKGSNAALANGDAGTREVTVVKVDARELDLENNNISLNFNYVMTYTAQRGKGLNTLVEKLTKDVNLSGVTYNSVLGAEMTNMGSGAINNNDDTKKPLSYDITKGLAADDDKIAYFVIFNDSGRQIEVSDLALSQTPVYGITVSADSEEEWGSVTIKNEKGETVTKAASGEKLTLDVQPAAGWKLAVSATDASQGEVTIGADNTFTMPDKAVTINVTCTDLSKLQIATLKVIYTTDGQDQGKVKEEEIYKEEDQHRETEVVKVDPNWKADFTLPSGDATAKYSFKEIKDAEGNPVETEYTLKPGENKIYVTVNYDGAFYEYQDFSSNGEVWGFTGSDTADVTYDAGGYIMLLGKWKDGHTATKNFDATITGKDKIGITFDFAPGIENVSKGRNSTFNLEDDEGNVIFSIFEGDQKQGSGSRFAVGETATSSSTLFTGIQHPSIVWYTIDLTIDFSAGTVTGTLKDTATKGNTVSKDISGQTSATKLAKMEAKDGYSAAVMYLDNVGLKQIN